MKGLKVRSIEQQGCLHKSGIKPGDIILSVNGETVEHPIDFSFLTATKKSSIIIRRGQSQSEVRLFRKDNESLGVEFNEPAIRRCRCRCIFCFIDQLPKGLRKNLYVKDEDCRHSFLNGNYVTLCSMGDCDLRQIARLGLSPLYISVHAIDPGIRTLMLRNRQAGKIAGQLALLEKMGIRFHAQIVLCPGINDNRILTESINYLTDFRRGLLSVAVVPVGITRFHRNGLKPVSPAQALQIIREVSELSDRDLKKSGTRRIYLSDEFYLKAGHSLPDKKYYGGYPQIENGVGLIRSLVEHWRSVKRKLLKLSQDNQKTYSKSGKNGKRFAILTSQSAFPYINRIVEELSLIFPDVKCTAYPVENNFFGNTVTVAGLLVAKDIIGTARKIRPEPSAIIIPSVVFNYRGFTLDGYSLERMTDICGVKMFSARDIEHILTVISSCSK